MLFRNDDVCFQSNINQYKEIQAIFEEFEIKETYSVVPYGKVIYDGDPVQIGLVELEKHNGDNLITDDKEVDTFIRESLDKGHKISLHGWSHTLITEYSYKDQLNKIGIARDFLERTYNTKIKYFVPPFNNYNEYTRLACNALGLTIIGTSDNQLEWLVDGNKDFTNQDYCWYHAWRFFRGNLTPNNLYLWLLQRNNQFKR